MLRLLLLSLLLGLTGSSAFAQTNKIDSWRAVVRHDTLPEENILLDKGWKYHRGDNPAWAARSLDDRNWISINPTLPIRQLSQVPTEGIGWLRLRLHIGDKLRQQPLILRITQFCASEIYLNGRLLQRYGRVSAQPDRVKPYGVNPEPITIDFDGQAEQVVAIRFASWPKAKLFNDNMLPYFIRVYLSDWPQWNSHSASHQEDSLRYGIGIGICLLLTLLHTAFFYYNPTQQANLYFAFYTLSLTTFFVLTISDSRFHAVDQYVYVVILGNILVQTISLWSLRALYSLFNRHLNALYYLYWSSVPIIIVLGFLSLIQVNQIVLVFIFTILIVLANVEQLWLIWQAIRQQKRGAYIIASGFTITLCTIIGRLILGITDVVSPELSTSFVLVLFLSPAFGISLYLAREFALDSQLLQLKLHQVQELSAQTLAQEQEKQHLLSTQNETLEQQVTERTAQLQTSLDDLKATQAQLVQKEKMASLGELTAGIAHEIQNPLNFVNNFSEVSAELVEELEEEHYKLQPDTDLLTELLTDLKDNLAKINHHGKRASGIVKGMLEHSRSSTGEVEPTNLNALAEEYLRLAYQGLRAKDKDFTCELLTHFDPTLKPVPVMAQELGRVLLNLFNNAFYAVKQKPKDPAYQPLIRVSTLQLKGRVQIQVSDNGTGMPESVQQKIFQPFFTTKPTGEGTGLGLSLSYDIVTKGHGGSLLVQSQPGEGTAFIIQLPMTGVGA